MNPAIDETKVNIKLVEAIVQLIRALPIAEQQILKERLAAEFKKSSEVTAQEIQ
jgi:hypothetical protein